MNGIRKRQNDVGFLPTTKAQSRSKTEKRKKKSNSFHPMSRSCFKATINQNDQSLSHYTISNNIAPQSPPRYPSFSTVRSLTSSLVSIDLLGPHPLKKSLHSKKSFSKPFPLLSLSLSLSLSLAATTTSTTTIPKIVIQNHVSCFFLSFSLSLLNIASTSSFYLMR